MANTCERLAASFGAGGADYDRLRPGYPSEALDWALPAVARVVSLPGPPEAGRVLEDQRCIGLRNTTHNPELLGARRTRLTPVLADARWRRPHAGCRR